MGIQWNTDTLSPYLDGLVQVSGHARTVIFTDLDGSLLDDGTHSYAAAIPALVELKKAGITLVPVTSKTAVEVRHLRVDLDLDGPYIVENGAAVFVPGAGGLERKRVLGCARGDLRRFLRDHREPFGLRGFGDMSTAEIAARTGLSDDAALRASQRAYTEPFLLREADRVDELVDRAWDHGFRIDRGGQFFHLTGRHDKGAAVCWLLDELERRHGTPARSIGIGDAPNDLPFLLAVDEPFTIPRPDGQHLHWPLGHGVRRAPVAGSRGWCYAVKEALGLPDEAEPTQA